MDNRRKYVIPGDVVTTGPFRPEQNVILDGNKIISTTIGVSRITSYNVCYTKLLRAVLALSFARIFYRNAVDGAFLLPIEIDEDAYHNISEGDQIDIDIKSNQIRNISKNQTYEMKPFSEIIGKIIDAGGLFNYKPD